MEPTVLDVPQAPEAENRDFASVENICRDFNVFMVHKIVPRYVEPNTPWTVLKEGVTEEPVLAKTVVAAEPDISCSTISEGDTPENFFGEERGIGLIINGGQVTFAGASDSFTEFNEDGEKVQDRLVNRFYDFHEDERGDVYSPLTPFAKRKIGGAVTSPEDIRFAIQQRRKSEEELTNYPFTTFNEMVVRSPKVGALFIVLRDYGVRGDSDFDNYMRNFDPETQSFMVDDIESGKIDDASSLALGLGIPSVVFYRCKFYKIDRVEQVERTEKQYRTKRVYLGEQFQVEEALDIPDPLQRDPSLKSRLRREVYQAKPFKDQNVLRLHKK